MRRAGPNGRLVMKLSPRTRRLIAYPLALGVVGTLLWFGSREVDADVETLAGAASVRAGMAQQIDPASPEGAELRARLLTEARDLTERAAAADPDAALVLETRGFLELVAGHPRSAAELYGLASRAADCEPVHRELLLLHEAKAWSNASEHERALDLLALAPESTVESVAFEREALRVRLLSRCGHRDDAVAAAVALAALPRQEALGVALGLVEAMGAWNEAALSLRKSHWQGPLRDYFLACLKLQSGDTDTAGSLLERSLETGDLEVARHIRRDKGLWITGIGTERFEQLMTPRAELATPPGAR